MALFRFVKGCVLLLIDWRPVVFFTGTSMRPGIQEATMANSKTQRTLIQVPPKKKQPLTHLRAA